MLKKNFNLKEWVIEFLHYYYNERTHSTNNYKSREIVERAQDNDFIWQVKDNSKKLRKIKKNKNEKYISIFISRISSLRYKDEYLIIFSTSGPIL